MRRALQGTGRRTSGTDSPLDSMVEYLLGTSGKGLRPLLVALAASLGSEGGISGERRQRLVDAAAAVELIHLASLVHDDIIDDASLRRGRPAVRACWGDADAVLLGDLLYARAFGLLADLGATQFVACMTRAIAAMCEAEIEQRANRFNPFQSEAGYLQRLRKKTGALLACACAYGGMIAGLSQEAIDRLWEYGESLGIAFQIADDLLDWSSTPEEAGKPVGNDLGQGVLTLPVLYALRGPGGHAIREILSACRETGLPPTDEEIGEIGRLIRQHGCLEASEATAHRWVERAKQWLDGISDGDAARRLRGLALSAVERRR